MEVKCKHRGKHCWVELNRKYWTEGGYQWHSGVLFLELIFISYFPLTILAEKNNELMRPKNMGKKLLLKRNELIRLMYRIILRKWLRKRKMSTVTQWTSLPIRCNGLKSKHLGCVTGELWQGSVHASRFCHPLGKLHAVMTTLLQGETANLACPEMICQQSQGKEQPVLGGCQSMACLTQQNESWDWGYGCHLP